MFAWADASIPWVEYKWRAHHVLPGTLHAMNRLEIVLEESSWRKDDQCGGSQTWSSFSLFTADSILPTLFMYSASKFVQRLYIKSVLMHFPHRKRERDRWRTLALGSCQASTRRPAGWQRDDRWGPFPCVQGRLPLPDSVQLAKQGELPRKAAEVWKLTASDHCGVKWTHEMRHQGCCLE